MAVVATAVAYGQGVGVGAEGDGGLLRVFAPDGDDAVAADIGVDLVGVQLLEVTDDGIVGKLLVAGGLRMLVQKMSYICIICHNAINKLQPFDLFAEEVAAMLEVAESVVAGCRR